MFLFLHGEDSYRSQKKLNEITAKFKEKTDPTGININTFYGKDFDIEKFNTASSQSGFLVTKRLIIVKNLLTSKPKKDLAGQLTELLKNLKGSDNIYIFWEQGSPDKRTALFKLLNKEKKYVQEFKALEYKELADWLKNYLKEAGSKMTTSAQQLLLSFTDNNLWQLANEVDKLVAYKKNEEITEEDVKQMVTAKVYENIFGLTDAIATGDKKKSLQLLQEQFQAGLNEQYVLTMIIRQFRILAQLKPLAEKYPEYQITKETKLHPFVVKKTLPQVKKFTEEKIIKIYDLLSNLDRKFKSTKLSPQTLIDLFIMKI